MLPGTLLVSFGKRKHRCQTTVGQYTMSLQDYAIPRDKFEEGASPQGAWGLAFPCWACIHSCKTPNVEPCLHCDHNANAVEDPDPVKPSRTTPEP